MRRFGAGAARTTLEKRTTWYPSGPSDRLVPRTGPGLLLRRSALRSVRRDGSCSVSHRCACALYISSDQIGAAAPAGVPNGAGELANPAEDDRTSGDAAAGKADAPDVDVSVGVVVVVVVSPPRAPIGRDGDSVGSPPGGGPCSDSIRARAAGAKGALLLVVVAAPAPALRACAVGRRPGVEVEDALWIVTGTPCAVAADALAFALALALAV